MNEGIIASIVEAVTRKTDKSGDRLYILMNRQLLADIKKNAPALYTVDSDARRFMGIALIEAECVKWFKVVS
tara:strand:- start:303 stop:518 length:216 start_codon:yes stop_codon:yes gene_type:complete